ncbi:MULTISPECIES: hypothetical protein [unclassified Microbulbifer]|uniref:hypothetical protein n=1 Tax=unclassified Microbulbifer TaxID=2619833 RepID=UPI000D52C81A|nr:MULTISPECIES: hypothetical protein [unclassified Microbulbifer]AWF83466.1 hypothetical protein BTJ40_14260 [Microbulbifer sp. A4B17]WHI46543.1 hypothetical protein P0078_23015 [Microbulbifer sp. VAAF005]
MRQFSILVIFALAFGGAAVMYEKESRKVKGVLTQITELQAQMGDLQAEINRLNSELEAVKLAERRRPNLSAMANRIRREGSGNSAQVAPKPKVEDRFEKSRNLMQSDVTSAPPAIQSNTRSNNDESEWSRPTVDADEYRGETGEEPAVVDPYQ